jgi:predicted DNA-binding protein (MmcQ/YjbR family)
MRTATRQRSAVSSRLSLAAFVCCAIVSGAERSNGQPGQFRMDDNQFNQWVFNGANGGGIDDDSDVVLYVEAADRACHLSQEQKDKLNLAGSGDFARFKHDLDQLRTEMVGKSYNQNEINNLYQKIQPFNARYQAGLLGETSLFAKVLHNTLNPEQREEYEAAELERRQARHNAKVRLLVAMFEQNCPLTSKQRDSLVELLLTDTKPAKRQSQYDWYVVIVQVAKIPDNKLTPILDKSQLQVIKKLTQQGRGMEQHLKTIGVLPD